MEIYPKAHILWIQSFCFDQIQMFSLSLTLVLFFMTCRSAACSIYLWLDVNNMLQQWDTFLWAEKRSNLTCSLYFSETCNQPLHWVWNVAPLLANLPLIAVVPSYRPQTRFYLSPAFGLFNQSRDRNIEAGPASRTEERLCAVLLLGETEGVSQYAPDGQPNYFSQRWGHILHGPITERGELVINNLQTNKQAG